MEERIFGTSFAVEGCDQTLRFEYRTCGGSWNEDPLNRTFMNERRLCVVLPEKESIGKFKVRPVGLWIGYTRRQNPRTAGELVALFEPQLAAALELEIDTNLVNCVYCGNHPVAVELRSIDACSLCITSALFLDCDVSELDVSRFNRTPAGGPE